MRVRIQIFKTSKVEIENIIGFFEDGNIEFLEGREPTKEQFKEMFGNICGFVSQCDLTRKKVRKFRVTSWVLNGG